MTSKKRAIHEAVRTPTPHWVQVADSKHGSRLCEYCGRPGVGPDRCPHAVDPYYRCPYAPREAERMRHIGV